MLLAYILDLGLLGLAMSYQVSAAVGAGCFVLIEEFIMKKKASR